MSANTRPGVVRGLPGPDVGYLTLHPVGDHDPIHPPAEIDINADGTHFQEWLTHLHAALPELAVHEAGQRAAAARAELDAAVAAARTAGASWTQIAAAADMSRQAAHERWAAPTASGQGTRAQ